MASWRPKRRPGDVIAGCCREICARGHRCDVCLSVRRFDYLPFGASPATDVGDFIDTWSLAVAGWSHVLHAEHDGGQRSRLQVSFGQTTFGGLARLSHRVVERHGLRRNQSAKRVMKCVLVHTVKPLVMPAACFQHAADDPPQAT